MHLQGFENTETEDLFKQVWSLLILFMCTTSMEIIYVSSLLVKIMHISYQSHSTVCEYTAISLTNMHNFNQSMKRRVNSTCALLLQPRFLKGRSADSIGYSNYFDVTHTNLTAFQKSC
jgi:hypothetical protein